MLEYFLTIDSKYLSWTLAKTLSAVMHAVQLPLLKSWIEYISKNLIQSFTQNRCIHLIELLTSFLSYSRHFSSEDDLRKCKNLLQLPLPLVEDNYFYICSELAPDWNSLVETFVKPPNSQFESHRLITFLNLWKSLGKLYLKDDLTSVYLNKKFILDFLSYRDVLESKAYNVYVDIIVHIFSSSLKWKPWDTCDSEAIETALSFAVEAGVLDVLSSDDNEFCYVIQKACNVKFITELEKEQPKLSLTSKRVLFIFFNLLAEFQNKQLLCQVLEKMLKTMSHLLFGKDDFVPIQVVDIFYEEDDLLFGVMLGTLRIYVNLQHEINTRVENPTLKLFHHDLNPHVVFIEMLQLLGYNYSELLSFLLSDETCCLLYLTHYLKLLLKEKDQFLHFQAMCINKSNQGMYCETGLKKSKRMSHRNQFFKSRKTLIETSDVIKLRNTSCTSNSLTTLKSHEICDTFENDFCTEPSVSSGIHHSSKTSYFSLGSSSLVSYSSSSSSSEEELEMECDVKGNEKLLITLSVLINLRNGIKKLVDLKEFPYNVGPLLSLLNSCEGLFT